MSQFTLYANCKKGNRPSFIEAGSPGKANALYEYIIKKMQRKCGTGRNRPVWCRHESESAE